MASIFEAGPGYGNGGTPPRNSLAPPEEYRNGHSHEACDVDARASLSPAALARLIEGEIIPRLLMAHRHDPPLLVAVPGSAAIAAGEAAAFVDQVLVQDVFGLLAAIDLLTARGVPLDTVYLDLLAPAARTLGEWWEADTCDFVDVTMGLWRLQQVVHELGSRAQRAAALARPDRRAFFTAAPGDQHSFGVIMIEDFFRRAGWRTASVPSVTEAALGDIVAGQWFELLGLTVTREDNIERLPAIIAALRKASCNPQLAIMVGGRIFTDAPALAAEVGADGTAPDARQAVLNAEELLDRRDIRPAADDAGSAGRG